MCIRDRCRAAGIALCRYPGCGLPEFSRRRPAVPGLSGGDCGASYSFMDLYVAVWKDEGQV